MNNKYITALIFVSLLMTGCATAGSFNHRPAVQAYMNTLEHQYGFKHQELEYVFSRVTPQPQLIRAMNRPTEKKPWFMYRPILVTDQRAQEGANFWHEHAQALASAEQQYGVPASIIVAIIGVETRYGMIQGKSPVINALTTLAFDYPPRERFFRSELTHFLLLTREQGWDPQRILGSYAGAIGQPQFMPSSYRKYAIDTSNKGYSDLINNSQDAIISVANYFKAYGWQSKQPVVVHAHVVGNRFLKLMTEKSLKPKLTLAQLKKYGVTPTVKLPASDRALFINLHRKSGPEFWLGLNNFYVITRYNNSVHYAMAVYQLSQKINALHQERESHV